ncbi:activator-dependent family glycosyltransferase [Amycolatopsis sp. cmx-4-68]|uniref:activator-dependent family glycosyltransferase n=1 Tax=Amycolatopsis sp. cmx-4-68 TaxID=2790938 RepID=UPI00397BB680
MKVLFAANPEKAHFLPMVPLAWALRTAGHEVRVACQPKFAPVVTQAGLTAVPAGRDGDLWDLMPRHPDYRGTAWRPAYGLPVPYEVAEFPEKAAPEYLAESYAAILHYWHKPACFPMIGGLVDFARAWEPDLVLWEPLCFAGPIAALASGAAHARLLWSTDVFGVTREHFLRANPARDPLGDWLGAYARKHGGEFTEDLVTGQFTIDQLPASLRLSSGLETVPLQYLPHGGPASVPDWLRRPPEKPRVALSMGISLTDHEAGYSVAVQDVLEHLARLDVEVVATLPDVEKAKLTRLPDGVRIVPYAPLEALAPTCDAVVSHGGFGTFLTTARHGVPQLCAPWDFDGPVFARRAADQGGALTVRADRATGAVVAEAVSRLLAEPVFAERARALRAEILGMPTPNDLTGRLEELAVKHR